MNDNMQKKGGNFTDREKKEIAKFNETAINRLPSMTEDEKIEFRNEIIIFLFSKYGAGQKNFYNYEEYVKAIDDAVFSYDSSESDNLFKYVMYILNKRKANYVYEEKVDKSLAILRKLEAYWKISGETLQIDRWENYPEKVKETICQAFKLNKYDAQKFFDEELDVDGINKIIDKKNIKEPVHVENLDTFSDKRQKENKGLLGEFGWYKVFAYIEKKALLKTTERKKIPEYKMINTNFVYNMSFDASKFHEHLHDGYEEYIKSKSKCEYEDVDIVVYKWFLDKPDISHTSADFESKESNFSTTYRKQYNRYRDNYLKQIIVVKKINNRPILFIDSEKMSEI